MASDVVEQQKQQEEEQGQAGSRSKLVQRLLSAGSNLPGFVTDLVTAQAVTVAGTEAAGFMLERAQDDVILRPIAHVRPDQSTAETRQAAISAFQDIIKPCIEQGKDGAIEINGSDGQMEPQFCLVTLLRADGETVAASAVITRCMNLERARQRLMSMQLVAGYFELFTLRRNSEQARTIAQSHQHVLQLATAVATAEGFESAARNLCNELATRSGASRVAVGWLKGRTIKVQALSHTEQFDKKQELIVQVQNAMEECLDQEEAVQFDPTGQGSTPNVSRAAQVLSRTQGGNIVLSLPLRKGEEVVGVVTLEFPPNQPLGPNVATGLAVAVDLLAPQLQDRYVNDRWLITKAGLSAKELAKKSIGPKYMITKLIVVLSVLTLLVICNWVPFLDLRPMYRVSAQFQFAPAQKMSLSAPFEGYIAEVLKKPGERVAKGEPLFALRTNELEIEKYKALSEVNVAMRTAEKHRAERKIAEEKVARAEAAAAQAQADLLQWQIDQATVRSPVDGEVLKGDLEDKIGAPVKREDVLMEVGPIDNLRVELTANERDVQFLHPGQRGKIATNSLPSDGYAIEVERIVPMGNPKDATNVFTVYAKAIDPPSPGWRPGMVGEARIDVEKKPLIWIWTHRLVEFLQLQLWM